MSPHPVYLHSIQTTVPPVSYSQDFARDRMMGWTENKRTQRIIRYLYNHSGIQNRHSVIEAFQPNSDELNFSTDRNGFLVEPSTGVRNDLFVTSAPALICEAGKKVLHSSGGVSPKEVTHVITMSCTGFCNPGPDLELVEALGLSPGVERYQLGFMGCYAAVPAMKMARQFCQANPEAVVLILSIELCSLHIQISDVPDQILGNAIFADGCAAALVSSTIPVDSPAFQLADFSSALVPTEERQMAWEIGDKGFRLSLTGYVPDILSSNVYPLVEGILAKNDLTFADIDSWAIHPGGKAILDKIEASLSLREQDVKPSREILKHYGNMSSATILFVLKDLLSVRAGGGSCTVFGMAFGPGLTVESSILRKIDPAERGPTP